jgi:Flp pilus assembly protein TadG
MALIMTTLFGMIGAGIDWGNVIIEDARLQHAADAAALAGVRAIVSNQGSPGPVDNTDPSCLNQYLSSPADAAARNYLNLHGYTASRDTVLCISFTSSLGTSFNDTITVEVDNTKPTMFWKMLGIQTTTSHVRSVARPGSALVDVMLSLDLTGSMEMSGTNDMAQLRQAVVDFINQLNPDAANPMGPKVGIARFAGIYCSWRRNGDGDARVEKYGANAEHIAPCYDDKSVLSNLTFTKNTLLKIAYNS